jgi:hypothetical protein
MGGDLSSVQQDSRGVCSMCGQSTELFELPGRTEGLCLGCSADVASAVVLRTEIDAATWAGQNANHLVAEFAQLSTRILARAQFADRLSSW